MSKYHNETKSNNDITYHQVKFVSYIRIAQFIIENKSDCKIHEPVEFCEHIKHKDNQKYSYKHKSVNDALAETFMLWKLN